MARVDVTIGAQAITRLEVPPAASASAMANAPSVTAGGGGGGGGVMATSVTQWGITITFDKAYPTFKFIQGDWGATPNPGDTGVTIASVSPALSGSGATLRNGHMINPSGQGQSYDGRAANLSGVTPVTLPRTILPGESFVKVASLAGTAGSGANTTYLDVAMVFTVLATVPATDAFRPPYFGTVKTIWRQSDIDTSKLPSKAPVAGAPSLANVEERFKRVQLDHSYATSPAGRPLPLQSFHKFGDPTTSHVYGENLAIDNCEAILRTFQNDSIPTKQNAVNYLVQAGIDWYGVANGIRVAANGGGGHQGGRKIVVAYAGWLLGSTAIKNVSSEVSGAGFGESEQLYWSAGAGGALSHFTSLGAGMVLFGYLNTFSKPFPYSGSGAKDIRDSSSMVDAGLSTQSPLGVHPATTSATYNGGLYIDIASSHLLLAGTIMGIVKDQMSDATLQAAYGFDLTVNYADRIWDWGLWASPDGSPGRSLGALVTALHGTGNHGAFISYGSPYGNAMRVYRTNSTFTG